MIKPARTPAPHDAIADHCLVATGSRPLAILAYQIRTNKSRDFTALIAPAHVLLVGHHLQVIRVHAHAATTQVIDVFVRRDVAILVRPHGTMNGNGGPV